MHLRVSMLHVLLLLLLLVGRWYVLEALLLLRLETLDKLLTDHVEVLGQSLGVGPPFTVFLQGELDALQAANASGKIVLVARPRR